MSKHKKSGKKHTSSNLADVTINDFANSSVCKNRIKKSTANVNKVLQKQLEDDKNWDEKTDDFEGNFVEQENEDGTISYVIQKTEPRRRKKTVSSSEDRKYENTGNEYPIDIWFLISEYIRPEDVGRFAGICKASYEVVSTAKFWFSMYKRYYKNVPNLPERLHPECLFRKYGIRTSVIRALNFMYKPFISRLKSLERLEQHPDTLKKSQCVLMWHKKTENQCLYFFKMKVNVHHHRTQKPGHRPDLLEMLDDVFANQDESCRILQVTCKHLIPIAPVLGLTLTSAQLNLSSELRSYKLQLWFGSEIQSCKPLSTGGNTLIILEPVINVRVLDWWHPLYPHSHNLEYLCNQE
ncbi:transmembrane protein 183 [Tribolium castaneum]|uniref:Transmembrane protein 183-like Protein n=1 Tax=Tribolium castaneum TaxID=7070 RepID=D6WC21_TRICA|nr:PREDICTED: transmembrane protein 183 [Tribolium castaneum]EEZ99147.1 Transmembrane protein 183-like Protein [Tribolium castaneum]|eukprot:XP_970412.1 PREDICTED: transmembrane protein 183 [Tribolium castaneum]